MAKQHRLVKKALASLNLESDSILTVKDIEHKISEYEYGINQLIDAISNAQETVDNLKEGLCTMRLLLKQVEVEEIQELNPKAKVSFI